MAYFRSIILLSLLGIGFASCGNRQSEQVQGSTDSLAIGYTLLKTLPHNTEAFTEGLTIYNNKVFESTGHNGKSWVAEVDPGSGEHDKKIILDNRYFGEGMTILDGKLYYLTWQSKVGFVYDATTYRQIREFTYNNEGWGLTHDGESLIMSDGTDRIYFLDTATFSVSRVLSVTDEGGKLKNLNELEYVEGYIYANVYETPMVVKIDPRSGRVVGRLDLSTIVAEIKRMYPNTADQN
jgi:glutamine cyclotransferase